MLQLHYHPSDASLAPHMLLEETGAPFELKLVDRSIQAQKSPEYLLLNPNGLIPVLVDGELVPYETAAILLHLADNHPAAGLAPAFRSAERAHFYKWMAWLGNTLHACLMPFFYPHRWADDERAVAQVKAPVPRFAPVNCWRCWTRNWHATANPGCWVHTTAPSTPMR